MTAQLKVIGKEHVGKIEFTGIEGGFGDGKKAMLVKDIAKIHGSTVKRINELLNRNRSRFRDGIDVIDLLTNEKFVVVLNDLGFSQNQINRSNNIYLLSERGYAKLLKILDDDKAWDIYDQLVDNYFNMRVALKEDSLSFKIPQTFSEALQLAADQAKKIEEQQPKVDYFDSQMRNPGLMTTTEIAKDFGMSATKFNKLLNNIGIQFKQGKHWVLYQQYTGLGYTQYEPYAYKSKNGKDGIHNNLKWTQKGRKFIYDELAKIGVRPTVEQLELLKA